MAAGYDRRVIWWWLLTACTPEPQAHDCDLSGPHVVVATTDFVTGALAASTPDGCVADRLASTSGDAVVRRSDERVWVLNRPGGNTLLGFGLGSYSVPEVEVVVSQGGNAHDLVQVGDRLFVSLFDEARVVVLDLDGGWVGDVDLAPFADGDGLPEVDALVATEAGLFAALQRLDRDDGWVGTEGQVVRIEPDSLEVVEAYVTGPNPRLFPASDGRSLVALTGHFFTADGALERLEPGVGVTEVVLAESELGLDLGWAAGGVLTGTGLQVGDDSVLGRWSDDAGFVVLEQSQAWYAEGVQAGGAVVAATRRGFGGAGQAGLRWVEGEGVREVSGFALDPFSVVWVDELSEGTRSR